jgi:hypothetical protein
MLCQMLIVQGILIKNCNKHILRLAAQLLWTGTLNGTLATWKMRLVMRNRQILPRFTTSLLLYLFACCKSSLEHSINFLLKG